MNGGVWNRRSQDWRLADQLGVVTVILAIDHGELG
jgi:hypothetical protein